VVKGAVLRTLAQATASIVFLDPPYKLEREYVEVMELLSQAPPELTVVQHSVRLTLADSYGKLQRTRVVRQGDNALSFFRAEGGDMQPAPDEFEQLKQRMRATWMAGDFGQIANYSAAAAEEFVARLGIEPGSQVLDVACGTGNLAIPAARAGARVTGVDIAPNLLEQARQRATAEALEIAFDEGDAENLPYADGQFDVVMSMFGAMFAPRPERVAAELIRVCRPGGVIAMANWTPEGFVGKMFGLGARFVPPPPGIAPPVLWGSEPVVRARLAEGTSEIHTERVMAPFDFPLEPAEVVQFFRRYFGPTQMAFARLDPPGQAGYAQALEELWTTNNEATGGRTVIHAEYLAVVATRA
jgi:SAM-dependent methyltransferase